MSTHILDSQSFDTAIKYDVWLVKFSTPWCNPCRMLDPILEDLSEEMKFRSDHRFYFGKVDIEENPEFASLFNISSVPTMIVFVNGEIAGVTIGFKTKDQILKLIEESL